MNQLPMTGTAGLLERLSPHIPDDLINAWWAQQPGPGRRSLFSPAQLFRLNLLALLTPAHSFNLLVELLGEQRSWRSFARVRNRLRLPDVRMLHEFRQRLNLSHLRQINQHLLQPLLAGAAAFEKTLALIDSTDLPAATNAYKKTRPANTPPPGRGLAGAAAKTATAATLWATKSTPCDCGCASIAPTCCWLP